MASDPSVHYRACNLCEAICGLEIRLDERGEIASIRGDADDPFSRGHICPKGVALQDLHSDPDRLRRPLVRDGDTFREVGWDEALDRAAAGLRGVQERHGRDAVAAYLGNPNVHNLGALIFGPPLLRALRTRHRYSATSVDQLPHHLAGWSLFGHQLLLPVPDLDRTDFFLCFGGNPAASNGSLMTAPDVKARLKAIRTRGGSVVVVDPRRTETAKLANAHHAVRPGRDALVLAAMTTTLFEERLVDLRHLGGFTDGIEAVRDALADLTPERVADATGLAAVTIRQLTREFAAAPSAVCYGRIGVSTQEFGGLCQWLIQVLNVLTGNLDRPGGAMFASPAVDLVAAGASRGSLGRWRSLVRGLPEFAGELPVATLAEDMLSDHPQRPRALITVAGNPILSTPDGRRLERAIEGLEFRVAVDIYLNETTRHADVILPPTSALERDHYDLVFNALAIRNVARYSEALFEPPADARHDWQIFAELLQRLDPSPSLRKRIERWAWIRLGPRGVLAMMLRFGPRGARFRPFGPGLTLGALRRAEHGLDLGPLERRLPERLRTKNGRLDLARQIYLDDVPRLREALDAATEHDADGGLLLIGRRQVRSNNSWMHNAPRLMRGKDRCTLLIHPSDAEQLGIVDGHAVRVTSDVGEIEVPAQIDDAMRPGVVSLPHGWGHGRSGARLRVANERPGASINDLTDPSRVDLLSGNAVLSGVPVRVAPIADLPLDLAAATAMSTEVAAPEASP
ncbi:MAG: molybdopterin oxidoreductase family protein [Acidobacteriota bacterium]